MIWGILYDRYLYATWMRWSLSAVLRETGWSDHNAVGLLVYLGTSCIEEKKTSDKALAQEL